MRGGLEPGGTVAGRPSTGRDPAVCLDGVAGARPTESGADVDDVAAELHDRVAEAAATRDRGGDTNRWDEDVVDPLGLPLDTYRAVAWELEEWSQRLVDRLFRPVPITVPPEAPGR